MCVRMHVSCTYTVRSFLFERSFSGEEGAPDKGMKGIKEGNRVKDKAAKESYFQLKIQPAFLPVKVNYISVTLTIALPLYGLVFQSGEAGFCSSECHFTQ